MTAVIIEEFAHVNNVFGGADKGGGDEIDIMLDAKEQIAFVLFTQIGHGQVHAGDVNALARGDFSAAEHGAMDIGFRCILDQQMHTAIVDQHAVAFLELAGQIAVADGNFLDAARYIAGGEGKISARFQKRAAILHFAQADLRSLGIQQHGGGNIQPVAYGAEAGDHFFVRFMGAVRKIEAGDVHAAAQHFFHNGFISAGGAQRANNLGFAHTLPRL